jgi:1-phosphofructokinase
VLILGFMHETLMYVLWATPIPLEMLCLTCIPILYICGLKGRQWCFSLTGVAVVLAGSLPPGVPTDVYALLITIARRAGAKTILDTNGSALRSGLAAGPDLLKPNRVEIEELVGAKIENERELAQAARQVLGMGVSRVVVSLGAEGALAASAREVWRARCPSLEARSSVGAGDAMVAALVYAMLKNLPEDESLRLATAAGSATASMSGSSVADFKLIQEFLPRIQMERLG